MHECFLFWVSDSVAVFPIGVVESEPVAGDSVRTCIILLEVGADGCAGLHFSMLTWC